MQLRWRFATSLALFLCACNSSDDDESGTEGASGGGGSSTTATTTDETETASDTVESASETNSGTSSGGADGSSGSADGSSTGGSSSTGDGSSTGEGSSSTGDPGSGLYGPCAGELICAAALDCVALDFGPNVGLNWCSQPCDGPDDCPDPEEGTATGACRPGVEDGDPDVCALVCNEQTVCPSGMDCYLGKGSDQGFCAFTADYVP